MTQRVLITGDLLTDQFLYEGQQRLAGTSLRGGAVSKCQLGGAGLMWQLLEAISKEATGALEVSPGFSVKADDPKLRRTLCVMTPCDESRKDRGKKAWRMTRSLGVTDGSFDMVIDAAASDALSARHDIVVLDDSNIGFRRWVNRAAWPAFLRPDKQGDVLTEALPQWIVLKASGQVAAGDLWHTIASGETQPAQDHFAIGDLAERTVVTLSVEDLRLEGVRVDRQLSWERAALDLKHDLDSNPRLASLKKVRFLAVRLGLDGAFVVDRSDAATPKYLLVFDPSSIEGQFAKSYHSDERVVGYQSTFTAGIVHKLACQTSAGTELQAVVDGVRTGLAAAQTLQHLGHGQVGMENPGFPFQSIALALRSTKLSFGTIEVPANTTPDWTIVGGGSAKPLWGLARRVAIHGTDQLMGVPYLRLGKLFSIDRLEIESLHILQRLLRNYQQDERATKPLSIVAFGPPGSGKSFGVKQLANAVFDDPALLEFNLSQFSDPNDLLGLYHQIRDAVLRGKLPVVFWDEFDSRELMWLQYLLSPMQDGTFQDGQITHPIGKCVFVFAGGTRDRFADFGEPPATLLKTGDEREVQKWRDDFRLKKGPDFKSRLAGFIDVQGPNPPEDASRNDITYPVRRALLLREHLSLGANQSLHMEAGLLDAFLRIDRYHHGARSLEKIAEQVRLSSRNGVFMRSDVPTALQLALHVNADVFLNIMETT